MPSPIRRPGFRRSVCRAAVLLAGVLAVVAPLAAQESLPARLSDAEFWKMTVEMSEPAGWFQSENYLSNEVGFQHPIPELQRVVKPGGVYLGVGPEQNFTYIAALHPRMAFIVDIRRGNTMGQLIYKALFELSADRADFLARLFSRPRPAGLDTTSSASVLLAAFRAVPRDSAMYDRTLAAMKAVLITQHGFTLSAGDLTNLETIFNVFFEAGPELSYSFGQVNGTNFGRGMPTYASLMVQDDGTGVMRSYLATEANWRVVRDLELRNLIVPLVGNFGHTTAIPAVGHYVAAHHAVVTAFYTSNVEQYLFQQGIQGTFYENVAALPIDSTSQFIRSGRIPGGSFGSFGGGGRGGLAASLIAPIGTMLEAWKEGKLYSWQDVLAMSH